MSKIGSVNRCALCGRLLPFEKLEARPFGLLACRDEMDCCATRAGAELRRRAKLATAKAGRCGR